MRFLFIALFFVYGCYTPSKADKELAKIQHKYPEKLVEKAKELYPSRIDSFSYIEWRDSIVKEFYQDTLHDSVLIPCEQLKKVITKFKTRIVQAPAVVIYREDTIRLSLISSQFENQKQMAEKFRTRWENWMRISIVFLILLLLSLIAQIIRHKVK